MLTSIVSIALFVLNLGHYYFFLMIISDICRKNVEVKFSVSASLVDPNAYGNITEMEYQVKLKNWEKERLAEDIKREEELLKQVKYLFGNQKQQLMDFRLAPSPVAKVHSQYLFISLKLQLLCKAAIQCNIRMY
jgi:hypothetical protein